MTAGIPDGFAFTRLSLQLPGSSSAHHYYSLRVSIGVLFSILIGALGVVLITYNFERHKDLALITASELFDHITLQTGGNVGEMYAPVETLVDLTAKLTPANGKSLQDRLPLLDYFAESLRNNPQLSAIYIGYSDGDFFLIRAVLDAGPVRANLAAPENTAFVVQSIERDESDAPRYDTLYFDNDLRRIDSQSAFVTGYDPRLRDWYQRAIRADGLIATDFYRFFTTGEIGTTIARQMAGGNAVVGADLTLDDIATGLQKQSLTPSTDIIVFAEDGTVLGHRNASWLTGLTQSSVRATLRAPHISDIDQPILDALFRRFVEGAHDTQLTLEVGDASWFGSVTPVAFGPHHKDSVFMAILVPVPLNNREK